MAFCIPCNTNFRVGYGGLNDVKRHSERMNHQKEVTASQKSHSIDSFIPGLSKHSIESQVLRAETLFCEFIAEHNIALLAADHFTELCKKMFSDSKIAA